MFDYDSRPVTPQVAIVGQRASTLGYQLRDFLSRNGIPYEWVEIDDAQRVGGLLDGGDVGPERLPICVLPDGSLLDAATVERFLERRWRDTAPKKLLKAHDAAHEAAKA